MKTLLLALLLVSSSAFAENWTTNDSLRESAFQVLNVIDWGQTRYVAEHPSRYEETESAWAIGHHPTTGRVDAYMAQTAVLHFAISYLLPRDWRTALQYITIGSKLNATIGNASIGIKVSF